MGEMLPLQKNTISIEWAGRKQVQVGEIPPEFPPKNIPALIGSFTTTLFKIISKIFDKVFDGCFLCFPLVFSPFSFVLQNCSLSSFKAIF